MTELERYTQARIGGNHAAETTEKFVAAKFEHDTARPVDGYAAPQLHTHAVIFNLTQRDDGTTRAIQPQSFFDSQQFATAVYQSELTYRLTRLGYEIEPGRSGAPEIKGYSQEYLDASSPRSQQIREAMERSGFSGPEAAQIAAHNTRDKKEIHSPGEVLAAHQRLAAEFGNQAERVIIDARERAKSRSEELITKPAHSAQEAVTFAKERGFEREAVTDERDILRDALRRGMGELTLPAVKANFEDRSTSGEFLNVAGQKHDTGRQITTRETVAAELATIGHMKHGQNTVEPIMKIDEAQKQAATRELLNPSQQTAIQDVLTNRDRIQGLQGLAGAGKTTTLASIREGAEKSGFAVEGFAPTSRAAQQLRDAGISADTLQGFLARGGQQQMAGDPHRRHLYMVDESSLASTRQVQAFMEKIGPQDRVLLIGDVRQHQGVDAGKPFEQMQQAGMRSAQLDTIVRQKDPELLRAVEHLSRNEISTGIELLQKQGRITEIPDDSRRVAVIAQDYAARPENTLVVSPDNASRRDINEAIRTELRALGVIAQDSHRMDVLTQRSDMTGADRGWAANYRPGDVLHYARGSKERGIECGSYTTVVAIDAKENRMTVERQDGTQIDYDPKRLQGVTAYREIACGFAEGDRIQFTATNRDLGVSNRDLGTIERIDGAQIAVRLDGDSQKTVTFDASQMRHFDHGYAVTSHSSQGLTFERVLINMDTTVHPELINTRFAYVSVSRASLDAHIYTNDAIRLSERLSTDVTKTSAVNLERPSSQTQTQESPERKETVMTNTREQSQEEQRRQFQAEANASQPDKLLAEQIDQRHHAPIQNALRDEAGGYDWKRETGDIESYQHKDHHGWLHIDQAGSFYDRQGLPVSRDTAIENAGHVSQAVDNTQSRTVSNPNDQGFSL